VPLLLGLFVVLRYQAGFLGNEPALLIVLPVMLLLLGAFCCLRSSRNMGGVAGGGQSPVSAGGSIGKSSSATHSSKALFQRVASITRPAPSYGATTDKV
jgi:hypothetical protein